MDFTVEDVGTLIREIEKEVRGKAAKSLVAEGLTVPQYSVLSQLSRTPMASNADIARAVSVTPQTTILIVQNLLKRELIARHHTEGRRVIATTLTDQGARLLTQADGHVSAARKEVFARITAEEMASLVTILRKLKS